VELNNKSGVPILALVPAGPPIPPLSLQQTRGRDRWAGGTGQREKKRDFRRGGTRHRDN
jgi:hypothetical protein